MALKPVGEDVLAKTDAVNQDALQRFIGQLPLKAYGSGTIGTHTIEFAQLLYILNSFPVRDLNAERLRSYFLYCINTLKTMEAQLHSRLNAVKTHK